MVDPDESPRFRADGLVLGAGTLLAKIADGETPRAHKRDVDRLSALLSVAYARPITGSALAHVEAAIVRRREGDESLAGLHLALSRLGRMADPVESARRLFMAEALMRGGLRPESVLAAAGLGVNEASRTLKYAPGQPHVPAGNGRASGEFASNTISGPSTPATPGRTPPPRSAPTASISRPLGAAASLTAEAPSATGLDLGALSEAALAQLARFLIRLGEAGASATAAGAVTFFGVLFIPSTGPQGRWVKVGGPGNIRYYHNPDVTTYEIEYTGADGVRRRLFLSPGPKGDYPGPDGKSIIRAVKVGAKYGVLISTAALLGEDSEEPRLCPKPQPDRNRTSRGKAYEDFMKLRTNPQQPTPSGLAYDFFSPTRGAGVLVDDCQQSTGNIFEYKGTGYDKHFQKKDFIWDHMESEMMSQSEAQFSARGSRKLTWIFAEKPVADEMRKLFDDRKPGIEVDWVPLPGAPQ